MKLLIVEDDFFKFTKVRNLALDLIEKIDIVSFDNVHDTINYLQCNIPDKLILDMSLPSHAPRPGEGSPLAMPSGGIEVLLELRHLHLTSLPIVILTQYPEIEIENEYYSIQDSGEVLNNIYGFKNLCVVNYDNEDLQWSIETRRFLENK